MRRLRLTTANVTTGTLFESVREKFQRTGGRRLPSKTRVNHQAAAAERRSAPLKRSEHVARYVEAATTQQSATRSYSASRGTPSRNRSGNSRRPDELPTTLPKRRSASQHREEEVAGQRLLSPVVSQVLSALGPQEQRQVMDALDLRCTPMEMAVMTTEQLFSMMRDAFEAGAGAGDEEVSGEYEQHGGTEPAKFRVTPLRSLHVAAVEVPNEAAAHDTTLTLRSRGNREARFAHVPQELLRRVLREEAGTAIVAKKLSLDCVVRCSKHLRVLPSAARRSKAVDISVASMHQSVLTSDVALRSVEMTATSAAVLANRVADPTLPYKSTRIEDQERTSVHDLVGLRRGGYMDVRRDSAEENVSRVKNMTPDAAASDDEGEGGDVPDRQKREEEDTVEALVPDEGGLNDALSSLLRDDDIVVPLSSNFVTRCDRGTSRFQPFSRGPIALRFVDPLATSLDPAYLSPVEGVPDNGTIVAVRVTHNSRTAVDCLVSEHNTALSALHRASLARDAKSVFNKSAPPRRTSAQIAADVKALRSATQQSLDQLQHGMTTDAPPQITVLIANDGGRDQFDFHALLFEEDRCAPPQLSTHPHF